MPLSRAVLCISLLGASWLFSHGLSAQTGISVEALEVITTNAQIASSSGEPGSCWGGHQSQIVRLDDGTVYAIYVAAGSAVDSAQWKLMRREKSGWVLAASDLAGREPAHLLRGPDSTLYIFSWPPPYGKLWTSHGSGANLTFTQENVPGTWAARTGGSTPYMGAGIGKDGTLLLMESDGGGYGDVPGYLLRAIRRSGVWSFVRQTLSERHCYTFAYPTDLGALWVTTRDVQWETMGYTRPTGAFTYVFNSVSVFDTLYQSPPVPLRRTKICDVVPPSPGIMVQGVQRDSYLDSRNRLHVLYETQVANQYAMRHAMWANGMIIKDSIIIDHAPNYWTDGYYRMVEDAEGGLYWIYNNNADVYVYPCLDTNGFQLGACTTLNLQGYNVVYSGMKWACPRGGNSRANWVDICYPSGSNGKDLIYMRLRLKPDKPSHTLQARSAAEEPEGFLSVYPNRFTFGGTFHFTGRLAANTALEIFNPAGQRMATLHTTANKTWEWAPEKSTSGVFIARLHTPDKTYQRTIIRLK